MRTFEKTVDWCAERVYNYEKLARARMKTIRFIVCSSLWSKMYGVKVDDFDRAVRDRVTEMENET